MTAVETPTVFNKLNDLARLPYFSVNDEDRLITSDPSIGPVIDVHTHLALAFLAPMSLDLQRLAPETQHYLPACCQFDLDIYSNLNFTHEQLHAMEDDFVKGNFRSGGMRATHTVPNIIREMTELGVTRSCILPIDLPAISDNAGNALKATKNEERLISFGSVHPYSWDMVGKVDDQGHRGIQGIKVHPAVQMVRPDAPKAMKLYKLAGDRGLPILWHCGKVGIQKALGEYMTDVKHYEKPVAENPKTTFILGHSGALQWEEALRLHQRYPNVYMELSSQSLSAVRAIVNQGDPDRLLFGSDWPFYHQALPLAKVLLATEGKPELRAKILFGNASRLLKVDV